MLEKSAGEQEMLTSPYKIGKRDIVTARVFIDDLENAAFNEDFEAFIAVCRVRTPPVN